MFDAVYWCCCKFYLNINVYTYLVYLTMLLFVDTFNLINTLNCYVVW